jgi:hypothetical protein
MTDIKENVIGLRGAKERICRVAYTLNNFQPVTCTIIDDQPLFYMDYGSDIHDEELLDSGDLKILEAEIENLQRQINAFDKPEERMTNTPEYCFEKFLENADSLDHGDGAKDEFTFKSLIEELSSSRMAKAYIDFAKQHGVEIVFCDLVDGAEYDRKSGKIFLNSNIQRDDQILVLARELRRHWQHRQGALINPLMFHPDNAVLVNRAQVADLVVSMVRIAWEIQLSGRRSVWERIENSSLGDLARAFAREAYMDFRTINNGQASASVFETWFLSERCRNEDKKLIKQMLADYHGYVFDLEGAGTQVTPTLIAALGEMPFGKNYLAMHADTIMGDPIFTEVRDRSNANFLWFIKFERSFRETEQELQGHNPGSADGIRQMAYQDKQGRDKTNETEESRASSGAQTTIVTLFEKDRDAQTDAGDQKDAKAKSKGRLAARGAGKKTSKTKQRSADIVYLRRWSGD